MQYINLISTSNKRYDAIPLEQEAVEVVECFFGTEMSGRGTAQVSDGGRKFQTGSLERWIVVLSKNTITLKRTDEPRDAEGERVSLNWEAVERKSFG